MLFGSLELVRIHEYRYRRNIELKCMPRIKLGRGLCRSRFYINFIFYPKHLAFCHCKPKMWQPWEQDCTKNWIHMNTKKEKKWISKTEKLGILSAKPKNWPIKQPNQNVTIKTPMLISLYYCSMCNVLI